MIPTSFLPFFHRVIFVILPAVCTQVTCLLGTKLTKGSIHLYHFARGWCVSKRSRILAHVYFFNSSILLKVTMNILFTMIYLNKIFVKKKQIIIFSGLIKLVSKEVKEERVQQGRRSSGSVEKGASFPRVRQTVVFPIHDELAKLNAR